MSTEYKTMVVVAIFLVVANLVIAADSMSQQGVWRKAMVLAESGIVRAGRALGIRSYRYEGRH